MHSVTLPSLSALPKDIAVGGCHLLIHFIARHWVIFVCMLLGSHVAMGILDSGPNEYHHPGIGAEFE